MGFGTIFRLLISELFSIEILGQESSIATVAIWLRNFLVSLTFIILQRLSENRE